MLPEDTHVRFTRDPDELNAALLNGFINAQDNPDIKRTHLFNDRYENIYITSEHITELDDLLKEACKYASEILNIDDLQAGCWFNDMPPGSITTAHSHDDYDELLSAVYYVSVPENSGELIMHHHDEHTAIKPKEGMFVFFPPNVVHEVSENMSNLHRLSIGINFGKRKHDED